MNVTCRYPGEQAMFANPLGEVCATPWPNSYRSLQDFTSRAWCRLEVLLCASLPLRDGGFRFVMLETPLLLFWLRPSHTIATLVCMIVLLRMVNYNNSTTVQCAMCYESNQWLAFFLFLLSACWAFVRFFVRFGTIVLFVGPYFSPKKQTTIDSNQELMRGCTATRHS